MRDTANPPISRYTSAAVSLHWIIAALLVLNTALAWTVDLLPDAWVRPVIDTHKSIGITVLLLVLLRIVWRLTHRPPPLPEGYASWERAASHVAHVALYFLIFALPFSGWMHDSAWKDGPSHPMTLFGLIPWPRIALIADLAADLKERLHDVFGVAHTLFGYALDALLALHVIAALKHQFVDREPELQRMWLAPRKS